MKIKWVIQSLKTNKYYDWYSWDWGCNEMDVTQLRNWLFNSIEDAQNEIVKNEDSLYDEILEVKQLIITQWEATF